MKSKSYLHYPMFWVGVILCLTVVGFPLGVLCLGVAIDQKARDDRMAA